MRALFAALVASLALVSTASAFTVVNNGTIAYRIDGVDNPTLNVVRGRTYTFNITATGHPFYIKTIQGSAPATPIATASPATAPRWERSRGSWPATRRRSCTTIARSTRT